MAGLRYLTVPAAGSLPDGADDRLCRFLDYWRGKCVGGALPHRRDIDPTDIAPLLAAVFLVDVESGAFRFRLVGQDIVTRYGNLRGRALGELMSGAELERTMAEHRLCVDARLPVYSENTMQSAGTGDWQLYQRLLVPLADDGGGIAALAGIMAFRSVRDPG